MKGKKLVFAVILSLIVCLLLLPTCAYASETDSVVYNSDSAADPVPPDGETPAAPDVDDTPDTPAGDDEGENAPPADDTLTPDPDEGDSDEESAPADDADDADDETGDDSAADLDDDDDADDTPAADLDDDDDEDDTPAADLDDDDDEDDTPDADLDDDDDADDTPDADLDDVDDEDDTPDADLDDDDDADDPDTVPDADATGAPLEKTGFQVELTYNGKMVKLSGLKGGESHDLAALLHELGIDGELTEAGGNADELFNVTRDERGMRFNTLMAFGDLYQLVVTVDGVQYIIDVTDDGNVLSTEKYTKLQDAIDAALAGQTIVLDRDFTERVVIDKDKTIIIDLNGRTLSYLDDNAYALFTVYGSLTINDSSANKTGLVQSKSSPTIVNYNSGTVNLNGGTFTRIPKNETSWNGLTSYVIKNLGTMVIDGATVKTQIGGAMISNGWETYYGTRDSHVDGQTAELTIKSGTLTSTYGSASAMLKNEYWGVIVIEDGTFTGPLLQNSGISATINGGTFKRLNGNNWIIGTYGDSLDGGEATTTINAGDFTSAGNIFPSSWERTGKNIIKGGTFNGTITKPKNVDMTVTSGIYTDKNIENYIDDNEVLVKSGDKYAVNESAYELAKNGEPVEIVKAPANTVIDNVPAGITVVNNSGAPIVINGIEVKNGETIVTAEPVAEAAPAAATCDAPVVKYWVVEGVNPEWTKGNTESLKFVLNSSAVVKVLVDGVEVDFELDENGEIIISAEVLEKLDAGEYVIEFVFADGSCKTKLFVK